MSAFSFRQRLRSFSHAFRGAGTLIRTQTNAWLHALATILVLVAGVALGISKTEWALIALAIALVWMAEALNTAIEFLSDEITEERRERIKRAKDVAAFAVLVSAVAALTIGLIVFLPHCLATK